MKKSEKKIVNFEVSSENVKIASLLRKDFLPIHICAVSDILPNNNNSNFPKEAQEESLPSWDNKPILGRFGDNIASLLKGEGQDFFEHDGGELILDEELEQYYYDYSKSTDEKIIGMVLPGTAKLVYHEDDELWWTECDAIIWCHYNYLQAKNLLKSKKKKISVEVEIVKVHEDENKYEIYDKFRLLGITILGDNLNCGVPNANLTVSAFSKTENFQKQMNLLTFACKNQGINVNSDTKLNTNVSIATKASKFTNLNEPRKLKSVKELIKSFEEEDIYHTNHPINPDNEDCKEIGFNDDENNDNKVTNSKKDGEEKKSQMLTYNMKQQLLDSALSEAIAKSYAADNRAYGWVRDFTDSEVYFYLDCSSEDGTYVAPYTITFTTDEDGTEKVENCVIDFESKERCVQTWTKMSEENEDDDDSNVSNQSATEGNKEVTMADDRAVEAPKLGDEDPEKPAPHNSDDDRATPKTGTYVEKKETETEETTSEDKKVTEAETCPDCGKAKSECKCSKETESQNKTKTKEYAETECNFEAKFTQLSQDYVVIQKENETLKSVNAKFESDIADLISKVSKFEQEAKDRHNKDMYTFAMNLVNAETDLTEICKTTMNANIKTECEAGKFANEEEVKKFTIGEIAMALYESRNTQKENMSKNEKNANKKEFVQDIVKTKPAMDALSKSRLALEQLGEED